MRDSLSSPDYGLIVKGGTPYVIHDSHKKVTGGLKLVTSRIKPEDSVKLREATGTVLPDPRFTKDHLENLRSRAAVSRPGHFRDPRR